MPNARWGSLYDALYGTDVISGKTTDGYDQEKADKVIKYVRNFLDNSFPLSKKWKDVTAIKVIDEKLIFSDDVDTMELKDNNKFIGFNGDKTAHHLFY